MLDFSRWTKSMERKECSEFTIANAAKIRIHFEKPQESSELEMAQASKDSSRRNDDEEEAVTEENIVATIEVMAKTQLAIQPILINTNDEEDRIPLSDVLVGFKRKVATKAS
ncbi:hypothetical protein RJT34_11980 [Clitoria ternatea]|uniref:Uncharacterized protein n=1 Tax=Clitoria ternatea TaxID=43366 RepID=A0AAN9JPJ6_CLITE